MLTNLNLRDLETILDALQDKYDSGKLQNEEVPLMRFTIGKVLEMTHEHKQWLINEYSKAGN
jgi:hypothetical protein